MNDDTLNYKEAFEHTLRELKMQVHVNQRLARNLIDVRLELEQLKLKARALEERLTERIG